MGDICIYVIRVSLISKEYYFAKFRLTIQNDSKHSEIVAFKNLKIKYSMYAIMWTG